MTLTAKIKQHARTLGFDSVGCCAPVDALAIDRFQQWLEAGYAGQMHYLPERANAYQHPSSILAGVRTLIMLTINYSASQRAANVVGQGKVARYAWGTDDYHNVIRERLKALGSFITSEAPQAHVRGVVDTAPLLERDYARWAGLGWVGKNTLLLQRDAGSWFFLAALLTDLELEYDEPFSSDHCGTCRACLDACPTDAFPQPYVLDATRCISYLTIELRDMIPVPFRAEIGEWVFGCDICQDVCPWNRKSPVAREPSFQPQDALNPLDLVALFALEDEQFRARFGHTPLWRPKRRGILRNAAIVLGNQPSTERSRGALIRGLHDCEPQVRSACAWALGRAAHVDAEQALSKRLVLETDDAVRREIQCARQALV